MHKCGDFFSDIEFLAFLQVLDSHDKTSDTTKKLFHKWLRVDKITKYDKVLGEITEMNLGVSDKEEDADVFTLIGSIYGNICISTFIDNVEYFWTWNNSTPWNKSKISLEKKSNDKKIVRRWWA